MMTAQDVYSATVQTLAASEQLRLATMMLDGFAGTATALDYSDQWSSDDVHDITVYAAEHAASHFAEE